MNKPDKLFRSVNAMLGVLAHYDSYRLRHELFDTEAFHRVGYFDRDMTQFFLKERLRVSESNHARMNCRA